MQVALTRPAAAAVAAALGSGEQPQVPDAAPDDPAEHVAAALVRRDDAVGDEHHRRPHVVGHHPQRDIGDVVAAVLLLGQLGGSLEHLPHGVDFVDVVDALEQRRHPLQAHAGVDVARRQRALGVEVHLAADRAELVLHEHEVPDLEVAVLVSLRAALAAVLGAPVVVDLRARAAGARHAHVPVVVGQAAALDPVRRHADRVVPDRVRLVVAGVDGRPEPAFRETESAVGLRPGQQLPRQRDGLLLEVVAEGEVAEHLEERGVPGGLADLFDVRRPHALLRADGARKGRHALAEEVRLEGNHPGVDQQQRGVLRDQAGRGDDGVPALREVVKETAGDLCRLHQRPSLGLSLACGPRRGAGLASLRGYCLNGGKPIHMSRCRSMYSAIPVRTSRTNAAVPAPAPRTDAARRRLPRGPGT